MLQMEIDYETAKRWDTAGKGMPVQMAIKVNSRYETE